MVSAHSRVVVDWRVDADQGAPEHAVNADTDHALLVLPDKPGTHRVYFACSSREQLAQMAAVVVSLVHEQGLFGLVAHILATNPMPGIFRDVDPGIDPGGRTVEPPAGGRAPS